MAYDMSQHAEPQSVQAIVVRDFARNYRSFLHHGKKQRKDEQSNLKKIYSEEVEPSRKHPHLEDNKGFS
jgi:hypothetical protein